MINFSSPLWNSFGSSHSCYTESTLNGIDLGRINSRIMAKYLTFKMRYLLILQVVLLGIYANGNTLTCPEKCKCSGHYKIVDCKGQSLTSIPKDIPTTVTELYLSKNFLTTIPAHALQGLVNLTELSLKNNFITSIQDGTFSDQKKLKRLFLTHNSIKKLSRNSFEGLVALESLYLTQNLLTSIPDLSFSINLSQLSLDLNKIRNATFPVGFKNLKRLKSVILAHNPIFNLNSTSFEHIRNDTLAKFDLAWCNLTIVEGNMFGRFSNHLQSLVLSFNGKLTLQSVQNIISSLNDSHLSSLDISSSINDPIPVDLFQPMSKVPLRTLKMRHTGIPALNNGTFDPLAALYYLDLSYSKVRVIADEALLPLKNLKTLNMRNCQLGVLPKGLPPSVSKMDFSYNYNLDVIPTGLFIKSSKTTNIDFSHCSITKIQKNAFLGLVKLEKLDLSHNHLAEDSISVTAFKSLSSLSELDLSRNEFNQIKTESLLFQGLVNLSKLDFSENNCKYLPPTIFDQISGIKFLNLELNQLGSFTRLFQKLKSLKWLKLSNNVITHLHNDTFHQLTNLTELYLDNNMISTWEYSTFEMTQQLTKLDLSFNDITALSKDSVMFFKPGLQVNLTGNQFHCWCDLVYFRHWFNTTAVMFTNNSTYKCGSPTAMQGSKFLDFNPQSIASKCSPPFWKYMVIGGAFALVVLTALTIILYRYRWNICLKVYHVRKLFRKRNEDQEPLFTEYDATLSYGPDAHVTQWVKEVFYPKFVEPGNWNKRLFFDEDILYGTGYSNEIGIMQDAMSNSRYIIVILNLSYLSDGRRRFEWQLAQQTAIEDGENAPTRKIIPVLFLNEGKETKLRSKLKNMLNDAICEEVLEWIDNEQNNELFWNQLKERIDAEPRQGMNNQNV